MLLSDEHKFIFVHIPRTGGTSIRETLAQELVSSTRKSGAQKVQKFLTDRIGSEAKNWLAARLQATSLKYFFTTAGHPSAALLQMTVRSFSEYKKFAFVRNPYARFVSSYRRATFKNRFSGTLEQYAENCCRHIQPQVNFVSHRGKIIVDYIGRFESIQSDFNHICDWIGLPQTELPVTSSSPDGDYLEFLTPQIRRKIEAAYKSDFETFNYPYL